MILKSDIILYIGNVSGISGIMVNSFTIIEYLFHLLIKAPECREVGDTDLVVRMKCLYGVETNESDFFKTLKERFSENFNRRADCSGTFWCECFVSVLLESESDLLPTIGVI